MHDGKYYLTEQQAQAILDLRFAETDPDLSMKKLLDEYRELLLQIAELLHILRSPERLMDVIREELSTAIKTHNITILVVLKSLKIPLILISKI